MEQVNWSKEKETLLIPLYGKARESQKRNPIIIDKKALSIVNQIDYNFSTLQIPEKTSTMMSLRARLIDDYVKDFLARHDDCAVLHLGCGLDSRYERIINEQVDWYDIDFPEVIEVRQLFYQESERYHLIGSSVTESQWLNHVSLNHQNYIVIAEGLLMYLQEQDIKSLLKSLQNKIGSYVLIFDAFSVYSSRKVNSHPSLKKTGAVVHWGIDSPRDLEEWELELGFITQIAFTSNPIIQRLDLPSRIIYKLADKIPLAKNAHRILIYQCNG